MRTRGYVTGMDDAQMFGRESQLAGVFFCLFFCVYDVRLPVLLLLAHPLFADERSVRLPRRMPSFRMQLKGKKERK